MSIAGKVLAVLVVLMAVVWVMLTAAVTQLNRNGTKAVEDLKGQIAKLEADVTAARRSLQVTKDEWTQDQVATRDSLAVLQARQSDVEKARTVLQEISTRVTLQLADAEVMVKSAAENRDQRVADKKAETEALAKGKADVEQLKAERTDLVNRLNELRTKFKTTLDENRSLTQRLQKKTGVPASRPAAAPARPASFSR
jgi:DNA repair exonuclease SbcCD ATPase subunit